MQGALGTAQLESGAEPSENGLWALLLLSVAQQEMANQRSGGDFKHKQVVETVPPEAKVHLPAVCRVMWYKQLEGNVYKD